MPSAAESSLSSPAMQWPVFADPEGRLVDSPQQPTPRQQQQHSSIVNTHNNTHNTNNNNNNNNNTH